MKKNIHNVGGFVAFSGESPKVINLITKVRDGRNPCLQTWGEAVTLLSLYSAKIMT